MFKNLKKFDPLIAGLIEEQQKRQEQVINLIASENYVSAAICEAVGSILTNKYAEGYAGRRYYAGCELHDEIETCAISRAKTLFGAQHVNVQPHSGATANMAAYFAFLKPQDTILAMHLDHGGHLTHGSAVNASGQFYRIISYGVHPESGYIDYEEVERLARMEKPKLIVAGASAYPRVIDFARFSRIAQEVGAKLMVDMAHIAGLVAAGVHPSPILFADVVTSTTHKTLRGPRGGLILSLKEHQKRIDSAVFPGMQGGPLMHVIAGKAVCFQEAIHPDFIQYQKKVIENARVLAQELMGQGFEVVSRGTDNHLILIDLRNKGISGRQAEETLRRVGIVVNKNKVPFDSAPAQIASGMRIGTPAVTTRGWGPSHMKELAGWITEALNAHEDAVLLSSIAQKVSALCRDFPLVLFH